MADRTRGVEPQAQDGEQREDDERDAGRVACVRREDLPGGRARRLPGCRSLLLARPGARAGGRVLERDDERRDGEVFVAIDP